MVATRYLTKPYQLDSKLNQTSLKVDKAIKTIIIILIASGRRGVAANSNISTTVGDGVDKQVRRHRRIMIGNNNNNKKKMLLSRENLPQCHLSTTNPTYGDTYKNSRPESIMNCRIFMVVPCIDDLRFFISPTNTHKIILDC
jgi:hypothetical protein